MGTVYEVVRKGVQREALWPTTLLARCSGLHNTCACGGGCETVGTSGTTTARYRYALRAGANKAWRYLFAGANVVYLTPPVLNTSVPNTDGGMGDTARFYGTM